MCLKICVFFDQFWSTVCSPGKLQDDDIILKDHSKRKTSIDDDIVQDNKREEKKKTKKVEGNENTNIATIPAKEIKKEDKKK